MAEDLIPPPSPAGRPKDDSGQAGRRQQPEERPAPDERDERHEPASDDPVIAVRPDGDDKPGWLESPSPRPEPAEQPHAESTGAGAAVEAPVALAASPHRSKFGLITGALIGIALAAAVIVIVAIASPDPAPPPAWSEWQPTSSDTFTAAAEIAQHVGRQYRLNDGTQLVDVESGPIALNDTPLNVVVRTASIGGDIIPIAGNGIWYVLNGLGERGSIAKETPSAKRLALLKREALELSLYTFRYVKDIDHVIAVLPPPPPESATATTDGAGATGTGGTSSSSSSSVIALADPNQPISAMLFRPGDLRQQLDVPLDLTLSSTTPRPQSISDRDEELVTDFTANNVFSASVKPIQTGDVFLILDRPLSPSSPQLTATPPGAAATPGATPTPAASPKAGSKSKSKKSG